MLSAFCGALALTAISYGGYSGYMWWKGNDDFKPRPISITHSNPVQRVSNMGITAIVNTNTGGDSTYQCSVCSSVTSNYVFLDQTNSNGKHYYCSWDCYRAEIKRKEIEREKKVSINDALKRRLDRVNKREETKERVTKKIKRLI